MGKEVVSEENDILVNNFGTSNPKTDLDIEKTAYEDLA